MYIQLDEKIFAPNLAYLRKKYALSQMALAKLTGCGVHYIRAIEKGVAYARLPQEVLDRLCLIFQVTQDELTQQKLRNPSDR